MLNDKVILITGGTGSFGKQFIQTILERYSQVKKIIIFSRDELKQQYPQQDYPQLRFCIGDVRDQLRMIQLRNQYSQGKCSKFASFSKKTCRP